jgi:hypothetical protein
MEEDMRKLVVCLLVLSLSACASAAKKQVPSDPTKTPVAAPVENAKEADASPSPAAPVLVEQDSYELIANALISGVQQPDTGKPSGFLKYIDNDKSRTIITFALKKYLDEKQAGDVAKFFESPAGKAGTKAFSTWMLTGKFLKEPVPGEISTGWQGFKATSSGLKFFSELNNIYKSIAVEALKIGGGAVKKALISDVGKQLAAPIFAAFLKSGGI